MRRFAFALLILCLALVSVSVFAQTPTVTVNPPTGTQGQNFIIEASGLTPNTLVTFDILLASNNSVVFSADRQSNGEGVATLSIRSDASDTLGGYIAQVKQGNTFLAMGSFVLVDSASVTPTAVMPTLLPTNPPSAATSAPAPDATSAPLGSGTATLVIVPDSAPQRATFTVYADGLEPAAELYVTVRSVLDGQIVYDRQWDADANGSLVIELFTTTDNAPGEYSVTIENNSGIALLTGNFMVEAVSGRNGVVTVTPTSGAAGSTFTFEISGAVAFKDITIEVIDPDTRTAIFETIARTNVDGFVSATFDVPADTAAKTYEVTAKDVDGDVASATVTVGQATAQPAVTPVPGAASVVVSPTEGALGRVFTVTALGLTPSSTATVRISVNGQILQAFDQRVNARGALSITYKNASTDALGVYTAEVVVNDSVVTSTTFTVTEALVPTPDATETAPVEATPAATAAVPTTGVTLAIEPQSAPRDTSHVITVNGLAPDSSATFRIIFDGQEIYTQDKVADASGMALLSLRTEASDPLGDYTVEVVVDGATVASGVFTVTDADTSATSTPTPDATTTPQATTTPAASGDGVTVVVEPGAGAPETSHLVTVTGLGANQAFTLSVLLDGVAQYDTDRTADADGNFSMRIKSDPDDAPGTYDVVIRDGATTLAQSTFSVTASGTVTSSIPADAQPVAPNTRTGDTTGASLTVEEPIFTYDLEATAGQLLNIQVSSTDFDTYLSVQDDTGYEVAYNDDSNGTDSEIAAFIVQYDGTYSVTVQSYDTYYADAEGDIAGDFSLTISSIVPTPFKVGQSGIISLSADASDQYLALQVNAGDVLSVVVTGDGLDTDLSLYDATGYEVATDDDGGTGYNPEIVRTIATDAGMYMLRIGTYDAGTAGDVVVTVQGSGSNSLDVGATQVRLNSKQPSDVVTFAGMSGTTRSLVITSEGAAGDLTIEVIQNGVTLTSFASNYGIPTDFTLPIVIPDDGSVSVTITTYSGAALLDVRVQ